MRKSGLLALAAAALVAGAATDAAARPDTPHGSPVTRLERQLAADARRLDLNGAVLVARNGRIIVRKGYGFADAARRVPNGPRTRFRITSLTSRFSLVAIEQLGLGRIDLDTSICAHIAACPATWQAITPRLILEGRSGLPLLPAGTPQRSLGGWVDWLRGQPLRSAPGTARDRGDARFLVAAHLVERASGRSWIDYVRTRIFAPAHMTDTVLDRPGLPRRATPYVRTRSRTLGPPASFKPLVVPDVLYGLASTVDDLYRFERALEDGTLLRKPADVRWVELGHGPHGTSDGWYTAFAHYPADRLTVLALNNMGGFFLGDELTRIFLTAVDWPPPRVRVAPATLERYAGRYTWFDGYRDRMVTATVTVRADGTLRLTSDRWAGLVVGGNRLGLRRTTLVPSGEHSFFAAGEGLVVTFEPGATPAPDSFLLQRREEMERGDRYRRAP